MTETKKISFSYKDIESMANKFLGYVNPDNIFPIDAASWDRAEKIYNAEIFYDNLKDDPSLLGSIVYDTRSEENIVMNRFNKNIVILINNSFSEACQLFTIAHEFGHYFLLNKEVPSFGTDDRTIFNKDCDENSTEYVANVFAGCVLMPMNEMQKYVDVNQLLSKKYSLSTDEIALLQEKFGVSENVVNERVNIIRKYYSLV